ncbi:hypothetical protein CBOM_04741 [Ceraceosorus bombacis]|uniref:Uncharacterized protein n=1 Tax=Ceraceosorus bombacis TaxID=401625 RepID=A0A0P1BQG2_9BASI|nr:hypothetical protein CBOM_04741 [Ceraceosorus bombacis]
MSPFVSIDARRDDRPVMEDWSGGRTDEGCMLDLGVGHLDPRNEANRFENSVNVKQQHE